jgi:hypothetical protein
MLISCCSEKKDTKVFLFSCGFCNAGITTQHMPSADTFPTDEDSKLEPPPPVAGGKYSVVSFRPDEATIILMRKAKEQGRVTSRLLNLAIQECFPKWLK